MSALPPTGAAVEIIPSTDVVSVPRVTPDESLITTVEHMRLFDLEAFCTRLSRVGRRRWDRYWIGAALLLAGGFVGGILGLIPFYSGNPTQNQQIAYFFALGVSGVLAGLCGLAGLCIKGEREDSVAAIHQDLETMLAAYRRANIER